MIHRRPVGVGDARVDVAGRLLGLFRLCRLGLGGAGGVDDLFSRVQGSAGGLERCLGLGIQESLQPSTVEVSRHDMPLGVWWRRERLARIDLVGRKHQLLILEQRGVGWCGARKRLELTLQPDVTVLQPYVSPMVRAPVIQARVASLILGSPLGSLDDAEPASREELATGKG